MGKGYTERAGEGPSMKICFNFGAICLNILSDSDFHPYNDSMKIGHNLSNTF